MLRRLFPLLLIIALIVVAYANSLSTPFIFDDTFRIMRNARLHSGDLAVFFAPRGLVYATFYANYVMGGLDTTPYHITNLVIHILACLLLFGIVRRIFMHTRELKNSASGIALVAASLWGLHPLQTESITYIVQRCESMTGCLMLLTLYCAVRAHSSSRPTHWRTFSVAACALSMWTKEIAIITPLLVLLCERAFFTNSMRQTLKQRSGFIFSVFGTLLVLGALILAAPDAYGRDTAGFGFEGISPFRYALTQFDVVPHYIRLAFYPSPLCLDYQWPAVESLSAVLLQILSISVAFAGSIVLYFKRPAYGFWAIWFFLLLAPSSSISPIADLAVEHRMYLPLAGICVLASICIYRASIMLPRRIGMLLRVCLAIAAIALLTAVTNLRNSDYSSVESIWRNTLETSPKNSRAYLNVGRSIVDRGGYADAIPYFQKAAELAPHDPRPLYNLGLCQIVTGRIDAGIQLCEQSIPMSDYREHKLYAQLNIAYGRTLKGEFEAATSIYREIITSTLPEWPYMVSEAHYRLANILERTDIEAAEKHYNEAINLSPGNAFAHNDLAILYLQKEQFDKGTRHLRMAIRANPSEVSFRKNLKRALQNQIRKRSTKTQQYGTASQTH